MSEIFTTVSTTPNNQNVDTTPIYQNTPFVPNDNEFEQSDIPENSIYTFDDNKDRLLDKREGRLFRYDQLDNYIYDQRTFSPTTDIPLQTKSAVPDKGVQHILPDTGYYGLDEVIVQPISDAYADISWVTAQPQDVAVGKIFIDNHGVEQEGLIQTVEPVDVIIDTSTTLHTYAPGTYNGNHTVSVITQNKRVVPKAGAQVVVADVGNVLQEVVVSAIPYSRTLNEAGGYTITIADE